MKKHTIDKRYLQWFLPVLAIVVVVIAVIDLTPTLLHEPSETTAEETLNALSPLDPVEDTSSIVEVIESTTQSETTAVPDTTAEEIQPDEITLTFLGLCSPGSPLGTTAYGSFNATVSREGTSYFLRGLSDILASDDLTIAATNCVFTDKSANSIACAGPLSNADIFVDGSIDFVSLATSMETLYDSDLLEQTSTALTDRKIQFANNAGTSYFTFGNSTIALYCTRISKGMDLADNRAAITAAQENANLVIVYFWCDDSKSQTPDEWLTYSLHQLVDAGAGLIVGCGNSNVLPLEQYKGTTIAYSLGSMLDGASFQKDANAALLSVDLEVGTAGTLSIKTELILCSSSENRWQPQRITEEKDENTTAETEPPRKNDELPITDR